MGVLKPNVDTELLALFENAAQKKYTTGEAVAIQKISDFSKAYIEMKEAAGKLADLVGRLEDSVNARYMTRSNVALGKLSKGFVGKRLSDPGDNGK
jgi:hypothetical protein